MTDPELVTLEHNITNAEEKIPFSESPSTWLYSLEFREFLNTWRAIANYYHTHVDEVIVEQLNFYVVNKYLRVTRMLNDILKKEEFIGYREDAKEALGELEDRIDTMTTAGFTKMARDQSLARMSKNKESDQK